MYLVTNLTTIADAFEGAAPRTVEEVMTERYPDCTIDANGRAHAPYDGFECEGTIYRGGEYLPFEDTEELRDGRGTYRPSMAVLCDGDVAIFEGTRGQIKAAREIAKQQQIEFDAAKGFIGTEKQRDEFALRIMSIFSDFGAYGMSHTHYLRDDDLNPVVYRGSKLLGKVGETLKVRATVKAHWQTPDGQRRATYITRPAEA